MYPAKDAARARIIIPGIVFPEIIPTNIPDQNPRHIVHENSSLIRGCNIIKKERISLRIRPCFKIYVSPSAANNWNIISYPQISCSPEFELSKISTPFEISLACSAVIIITLP